MLATRIKSTRTDGDTVLPNVSISVPPPHVVLFQGPPPLLLADAPAVQELQALAPRQQVSETPDAKPQVLLLVGVARIARVGHEAEVDQRRRRPRVRQRSEAGRGGQAVLVHAERGQPGQRARPPRRRVVARRERAPVQGQAAQAGQHGERAQVTAAADAQIWYLVAIFTRIITGYSYLLCAVYVN